jgi:cyclopropane fatty-acyl-phospholipid synthase-like methyltransferase
MVGVNAYHRALTDEEITAGAHRQFVGGLWDEIGKLQFRFLVAEGLQPGHALVDIGCGALRGGVHFVRYLERGHYHGLDINPSLIAAGRLELQRANLADREAQLLADDRFDLSRFGRRFDYGIGVSLFSHLFLNHIARCLIEMRKVMHDGSRFFCTFFEAPSPVHMASIRHTPGNALTHYDADPFHYAFAELEQLAAQCGRGRA